MIYLPHVATVHYVHDNIVRKRLSWGTAEPKSSGGSYKVKEVHSI